MHVIRSVGTGHIRSSNPYARLGTDDGQYPVALQALTFAAPEEVERHIHHRRHVRVIELIAAEECSLRIESRRWMIGASSKRWIPVVVPSITGPCRLANTYILFSHAPLNSPSVSSPYRQGLTSLVGWAYRTGSTSVHYRSRCQRSGRSASTRWQRHRHPRIHYSTTGSPREKTVSTYTHAHLSTPDMVDRMQCSAVLIHDPPRAIRSN